MDAEDQAVTNFNSLRPIAFSILVNFGISEQIFSDGSPPEFKVDIVLRSDSEDLLPDSNPTRRLMLSFDGVRELNIGQPQSSLFDIGFLKIRSIRARQWEGLNYEIQSDDDSISFLCRHFEAALQN